MPGDADFYRAVPSWASTLLVRPTPASDESDAGYLCRLATVNGLRTSYLQRIDKNDNDEDRLLGYAVPGWLLNQTWKNTSPVCVSCLRTSGIVKQSWRVKYVLSCAEHDEKLVVLRTGQGKTRNLAEILSINPADLPNLSVNLVDQEAEAHTLFKSLWPDLWAGSAASAQSLATSIFLSSLLSQLTLARRGRDIQDKKHPIWVLISQWVSSNNIRLDATVVSCEALLSALPTVLHQAVAIRFLENALKSEGVHETVLSTLPLSDWLQRVRRLAGPIRTSGRGALGGIAIGAMTTDGMPVQTAVRRIGLSRNRFIALMHAEGIEPIRRAGRTRKFVVIDANDVQRLAESAAEHLHRATVMSVLQIKGQRFIMRILRLIGAVSRIRHQQYEFYTKEQIQALLTSLIKWAEPYQGQPSVSLADPVFYRHVDVRVVRHVFDSIKHGSMRTWYEPTASGLKAIRVPLDVLAKNRRMSLQYRYVGCLEPAQLELFHAA